MSEITTNTLAILAVSAQMYMTDQVEPVPILISGKPGVGKTEVMAQVADRIREYHSEAATARLEALQERLANLMDNDVVDAAEVRRVERALVSEFFELSVISGPQLNPEDIGGIPIPNMETRRCDSFMLNLVPPTAEYGLLVIDEFGSLNSGAQAPLLNLIQNGIMGTQRLSPGIMRAAIMNPLDCASNPVPLDTPVANRFVHLPWDENDSSSWLDYMRGGKGLVARVPKLVAGWSVRIPIWRTKIAQFIESNRDALHDMPKGEESSGAWASNRMWTNLATLLAAMEGAGLTERTTAFEQAIIGSVGKAHGVAFSQYIRELDLPNPIELLTEMDAYLTACNGLDADGKPNQTPKNAAGVKITRPKIPTKVDSAFLTIQNIAQTFIEEKDPRKRVAYYNAAWELYHDTIMTNPSVAHYAVMRLIQGKPQSDPKKLYKSPRCKAHIISVLEDSNTIVF